MLNHTKKKSKRQELKTNIIQKNTPNVRVCFSDSRD